MRNQPPCIAWAEKLALRREDLSPADRAALDAHLQTCSACEAAQEDYHFLDSRLRALPLSPLKPFPRLSTQIFAHDATTDIPEKIRVRDTDSLPRVSLPVRRRSASHLAFILQRAIPVTLVATLILALLTIFGFQIISRTGFHATGSTILSYQGHSDYVDAVAWSPNGQYIASGGWDGIVQVWDAQTGASIITYRGQSDVVSAVAWSPDGQYIASASWDGTVRVWNAFTGQLRTLYTNHTDIVSALSWSPNGQYIASASWDSTVQVWYALTGETIRVYRGHTEFGHGEFVDAVAWSPNGQYIASGDRSNTIKVWDPFSGKTLMTDDEFNWDGGIVEAIAWSPDGTRIAVGSRDKSVRIWQAFNGQLLLNYSRHTNEVSALAWSPNGRYIASGSWDRTVQVWYAPPSPAR